MDADLKTALQLQCERYFKRSLKHIDYGTSGFRDKATELTHVMYRMGLFAVLRSKTQLGATIGIMITASHNPEEDNGIKLVDPLGNMLPRDWEIFATKLANASNEELVENLLSIIERNNIDYKSSANVYLGRDTRKSSPSLAQAALDGIRALGGQVTDFGLLTTPQLQYVVCCKNDNRYGSPTEDGYYEKLSASFEKLVSEKVKLNTNYQSDVFIDCANGVGALKLIKMAPYLPSLQMIIVNDGSEGILNDKCGADFVKIMQRPPPSMTVSHSKRYASIDGDADRIIYFYCDEDSTFHMLDGGKIAVLMAKYLKELIDSLHLSLKLKVVLTAYTNGNCTRYIENELNIPVSCVPTGVKHLHHEAKQSDIGVYFEANGHLSILFSEQTKSILQELGKSDRIEIQQKAAKFLNVIDLVNETTGDAISDLLLVEAILCDWGWDIKDWDCLYSDVPCRQEKVVVRDRNLIKTTKDGKTCPSLQEAIDSLVSQFNKGRAFVRPSGTEDVVRIYAEADTQENANTLAQKIIPLVLDFAK